jgi:hypothetical protein
MNFTDDTVMAYADGELDAATRAALEAVMATDRELAQRVARQQALRARLRAAFDPVLAEPVPQRLLETARSTPAPPHTDNVIPLKRRPAPPRWSWPQWSAIAASLVLGALLGPLLLRTPSGTPFVTRDGQVLASGALARALSEQLAGTQSAQAPVRIGVSFRARSGLYCRTFVLHERDALAGLACRDQQAWRLEALARNAPAPASGAEYRPAASALPPALARTVDELIAGEPLDAAAESAARARAWR